MAALLEAGHEVLLATSSEVAAGLGCADHLRLPRGCGLAWSQLRDSAVGDLVRSSRAEVGLAVAPLAAGIDADAGIPWWVDLGGVEEDAPLPAAWDAVAAVVSVDRPAQVARLPRPAGGRPACEILREYPGPHGAGGHPVEPPLTLAWQGTPESLGDPGRLAEALADLARAHQFELVLRGPHPTGSTWGRRFVGAVRRKGADDQIGLRPPDPAIRPRVLVLGADPDPTSHSSFEAMRAFAAGTALVLSTLGRGDALEELEPLLPVFPEGDPEAAAEAVLKAFWDPEALARAGIAREFLAILASAAVALAPLLEWVASRGAAVASCEARKTLEAATSRRSARVREVVVERWTAVSFERDRFAWALHESEQRRSAAEEALAAIHASRLWSWYHRYHGVRRRAVALPKRMMGGISRLLKRVGMAAAESLTGTGLAATGAATFLVSRMRARKAATEMRSPAGYRLDPDLPDRRPRVLLVSPYPIHPPNHGGGVRVANLVRELGSRCDLFVLVFSRDADDEPQRKALEPFCKGVYFHRWQPAFGRPAWTVTPPGMRLFWSERAAARIRDIVRSHEIDVVQLECTELAPFIESARPAKVVLTLYDIAFRSARRRRRLGFHRRYPHSRAFGANAVDWLRLMRAEIAACRRADQIHVMSEEDASYLAAYLPDGRRRIRVISNGVDVAGYQPPSPAPDRDGVLYVGNFQHLPNVDAVEHFVRDVWPLVRLRRPDATFTIVGAHSEIVAGLGELPGVEVVGEVEDVRPYYHRHRVLVVPIRAGSGTRLKLLEAFAAGLPTVSTTLGAEGLPVKTGEHLLLADTPLAMAQAVEALLGDEEACRALAAKAHRLAAATFDWSRIARESYRSLAELVDTREVGETDAGRSRSPQGRADVSVVIPTYRGGPRLLEAVDAVLAQETGRRVEIVCVDSGSPEEDLRALQDRGVLVHSIPKSSFDHGLTRDLGARISSGRILVFVNQDAVPRDERWLEALVGPLGPEEPHVAAVQGAVLEVPEIESRFFWESCGDRFYFTRETRSWLQRHGGIGFSTVNAAIRREVWERFPFGWAPIMEDKKWQGTVVEAGYEIVAAPAAAVFHTHDYDLKTLSRRCLSEGLGWRLLGERYLLSDALRDMGQRRVWRELLRGLRERRIRSSAELLFPCVRPLMLYRGNRWADEVRL